ncbi:MAG: caspase family protein [bacterium]
MKKIICCIFIILILGYFFCPKISFCEDRGIFVSSKDINNLPSKGEFWGFLIGINKYDEWDPLQTAVNDVKKIYELLIHKYGFPEENIVLLINQDATRRRIIKEFRSLIGKVKQDDNLFIYFAGHGYLDTELNTGNWIPSDSKFSDYSTYIPNSTIHDLIKAAGCKHIYLVSDSCFSGTLLLRSVFKPPAKIDYNYIKNYGKLKSRQVLTSGHIQPVSDTGFENHSIFAYYFIKILEDNEELYITPLSIFEKIKLFISRNAQQIPICRPLEGTMDEGGEFIFINFLYNDDLKVHKDILLKDKEIDLERQKLQKDMEELQQQKKKLEEMQKILQEKKTLMNEQQNINEEIKAVEEELFEIQKKQEINSQKKPLEKDEKSDLLEKNKEKNLKEEKKIFKTPFTF